MKRSLLITAFVLASFFSVSSLKAQTTTFRVENDSVNWISPLGATFGDTIFYNFRLRNIGGPAFVGSLSFLRRVDGGQVDTIETTNPVTIQQNDTMGFTISEVLSSARYGGGINIVVVWPAAPNIVVEDSANGGYTVTAVGIDDPAIDRYPMQIFPNPAAHSLHFKYDFPKSMVTTFRVMDQQGRILRVMEGLPRSLDVAELPNGIYFLEARFRDGLRRRFKLVVTH